MVRPMILRNTMIKMFTLIISSSFRCVDYPIFILMFLFEECLDLKCSQLAVKVTYSFNRIPVIAFQSTRGVAHGDYSRGNIGEIQIEVSFNYPTPSLGNLVPNIIHYLIIN
jgi:hypothetical protein